MRLATRRAAGAVLLLLGAGLTVYLVVASRADDQAARRAQEQLSAQFRQSLTAAGQALDDPTVGSTVTTAPLTVTTTPGEDIAGPEIRRRVPAPIPEAPPPEGQAVGRIVIPAAGVDWVVVEGVSRADLTQGPGHMPGTPLPGQPGNAVISGHRTTYGAPFRELDLLQPGDEITVETVIGTHSYRVVEVLAVAPNATWVTNQVPGAWLTLTTCHPEGTAQQRLIVFARLVAGPNAPALAGLPDGGQPPRPDQG